MAVADHWQVWLNFHRNAEQRLEGIVLPRSVGFCRRVRQAKLQHPIHGLFSTLVAIAVALLRGMENAAPEPYQYTTRATPAGVLGG